jgi:hypothetical protein
VGQSEFALLAQDASMCHKTIMRSCIYWLSVAAEFGGISLDEDSTFWLFSKLCS